MDEHTPRGRRAVPAGSAVRGGWGLWAGLALFAVDSAASQVVVEPDTSRRAAQLLLLDAPLLQDSMTVTQEMEYVERVLAFFNAMAERDSLVRIRSGADAVRALEGVLVPDSVSVSLQSDPPGFQVHFYRLVDGRQTAVTLVTDTVVVVPAGLYRVGFFNTTTGELREQARACLQTCRVRWRF